ncbi:hypothetical protein L210DRAFT_3072017 [Boletus edulis BED1]|uniref:Uncharacterized protein n=1 Tax=Boletus edulis BED1 TaxID=1328754 RepID=A0AAD4BHR3_BOLED|nr:hypothetical protein L210DRAFT_3072017 [Boletus edulis BED1]
MPRLCPLEPPTVKSAAQAFRLNIMGRPLWPTSPLMLTPSTAMLSWAVSGLPTLRTVSMVFTLLLQTMPDVATRYSRLKGRYFRAVLHCMIGSLLILTFCFYVLLICKFQSTSPQTCVHLHEDDVVACREIRRGLDG